MGFNSGFKGLKETEERKSGNVRGCFLTVRRQNICTRTGSFVCRL